MISAVLFDLDVTLVETEELKAVSHARSVAEFKPDVSEDEVVSAYTDELVATRARRSLRPSCNASGWRRRPASAWRSSGSRSRGRCS